MRVTMGWIKPEIKNAFPSTWRFKAMQGMTEIIPAKTVEFEVLQSRDPEALAVCLTVRDAELDLEWLQNIQRALVTHLGDEFNRNGNVT